MFRVACVLTVHELDSKPTDLIVFPEGVDWAELRQAEGAYPDAAIVGAVADTSGCHGVLLHEKRSRIDYLKVEYDGRTPGSGVLPKTPIYAYGATCIGVVICMDVQNGVLLRSVIGKLRSSAARFKVLCIPGDMSNAYFNGNELPPTQYVGVHVVLCNHTKTHPQARCKSFVAGPDGYKIKVQQHVEPIRAELL